MITSILLFVLPEIVQASPNVVNDEIQLQVDEQLETLGIDEITQYWEEIVTEYGGYLPESQKGSLLEFISGEKKLSLKEWMLGLVKYIFHELITNGKLLSTLIMLTVFSMFLQTLENSFEALFQKDLELAHQVIIQDVEINRMEEAINDRVIKLMTRQQPVATDLRRLIVLLKAASDMERVGDHAVNIAKEAIRIGNERFITSVELLEDMCYKSTEMLRQVVEAFKEENMSKAKVIAEYDDEIDEMYGNMIKHLMQLSSVVPENISQITYLSFICRFVERCADHATNIAEYLLYLKKGQRFDLNH